MLDFFQTELRHGKRQGGKQRHLCGVQCENAEIQVEKLAVTEDFAHARGLRLCVFVQFGHFGVGSHPSDNAYADDGQDTGQHKQSGNADYVGNHRGDHQADGKGQTYAQTYHRHCAGTHAVPGQVGKQRGHCGADCARPLDGARGNQHGQ